MSRVLVVQGPTGIGQPLEMVLAEGAHQVQTATDVYEALAAMEATDPEIVLLNIAAPALDGPEIVRHILDLAPDVQVIVAVEVTGLAQAVQALTLGASDFLLLPVTAPALRVALSRAEDKIRMRTRLRQAVAEIRQRHEFERKLIMTSMDGIIANDPEGQIIIFNDGAARIYGYAPDEALGKLHVTQLYPEGEARRVKKAIFGPEYGGRGRLINYPTLALTKSKQLTPIVLSATLIVEKGAEVATVGYFKDLSEILRQLSPDRFPAGPGLVALVHELLAALKDLQTAARDFEHSRAGGDSEQLHQHCREVRERLEHLAGLLETAGRPRTDQPPEPAEKTPSA